MAAKTQRHLIVVMAVIGFIASSSCTRSGESNPPIKQDPQATTTPIPTEPSELDKQTGKSAQDDKGPRPSAPKPPAQTAPRAPHVPDQVENLDPQVVTYDPSGMTPSQIFDQSGKQNPALIGNPSEVPNGPSGETLNYSGSGQDGLRDQLQTFVDNQADTQTRSERNERDKKFAKTIGDARFDVDWLSRTATLEISVKGPKGLKVYRFNSPLTNKLLVHAGDLRRGRHLSVEAACMDLNGGCNTVYAKVQDGTGGLVRTAHVLIRTTKATLYTHADGFHLAHNEEFDVLLHTLVNTVKHSGELDALNSLTLRTSETINGQSNFQVEMGIRSSMNFQDSLNFTGPLVKPATDIKLEAPAQLVRSSSPMANTIRSVSLVNNDGRGTLTLAITVRKGTVDADEDIMDVTVARIHRPVRLLIVK